MGQKINQLFQSSTRTYRLPQDANRTKFAASIDSTSKKDIAMPSFLAGLIMNKCPNCREGKVFVQKGIFPLSSLLKMNEYCPKCGQKLLHERNNGGGINYALTMILFFLNLVWYWPIFGLSYMDNSVYYFLGASSVVVILLQPLLMRLSRMIYLYLFIGYKKGSVQ